MTDCFREHGGLELPLRNFLIMGRLSGILLSVVRLGMSAGTEHTGPLLIIGVGVEMASTVISMPLQQIVSKPDHGGSCLSSYHGNLETVMLFISRAQGTRSGLGGLWQGASIARKKF